MKKHRILSLVWQLSLVIALIQALTGCVLLKEPAPGLIKHQQALDLVDQGTLLLRANRLDQAQGAFSAAADLGPLAAALDGLGCVAFMRQDFETAEKYFVAAYEADKQYTSSLGNLALLYEVNGFFEKAGEFYKMALASEPENFRTRNNFAAHLLDNKDRGRAKLELLKALALAKHPVIASNLMRIEEYE